MNIFYTQTIEGKKAFLDETDSHHCLKVLRLKTGDPVNVVDGKGGLYKGLLFNDKGLAVIEITEHTPEYGLMKYNLHVAIAPTKNIERFEWFLEKATEIGVSTITPIICDRSERKVLRYDRLEKVIISAMKQSVKAFKPVLNELTGLEKFTRVIRGGSRFIAYVDRGNDNYLINAIVPGEEITVLIGPEGDFTPDEIKYSVENNFKPVSLGESRLRTETAGISVCQIVSDWSFINR